MSVVKRVCSLKGKYITFHVDVDTVNYSECDILAESSPTANSVVAMSLDAGRTTNYFSLDF